MEKKILHPAWITNRYQIKILLAAILSFGLFATVNAQNTGRERNDNSRPQVSHKTVTRQNAPVAARQKRPVATQPNRSVVTRQRTTSTPQVARATPNRTVASRTTNYRRPVYDAHNPSWRYANVPKRNTVITVVPTGYNIVKYGGYDYRYYRGVFYRPYNNTFMVVAPPIGIFIDVMPFGYRKIMVNNNPYYYYNGSYYQNRDSRYYVVSPPEGAVVESLPAGYETLTIDGETYYTVDGAQYKPVVKNNGEIWYQVIKAN